MLGNCNIWGSPIYGDLIYTQPCFFDMYDFAISVFDVTTNDPLSNIVWELYRRDTNISVDGVVDESHILVDGGTSLDGYIYIILTDYNLRYITTDYYLKSWKSEDNKYMGRLRFKYLSDDYTSKDTNWPYVTDTLQIAKEVLKTGGGGGGMGGSVVTHTEYRDKPLPVIKVMAMSDDEDIENKEIWIIDIKDLDSL